MNTAHSDPEPSRSGLIKTTTSPSSRTTPSAPEHSGADFDAGIGSQFFMWAVTFLEKHGRKMYGEKFRIDPADYDVVHKLLVYFLGLKKAARTLNIDLTKGIMLSGPIGSGKTALITLMKYVARPDRFFFMKTCRQVSFEFINDGIGVIHHYSILSYDGHGPKAYCFDDLGSESALHHYGNDCCPMAEILLSRYDLFIHTHMITHVTTNLAADELEKHYGNRVRSRMREMFNLISFKNGTSDKR